MAKRHTKQEKEELLSEFESSQESKTNFCRRRNIGITTLYRWQIQNQKQNKLDTIRLLPVVSPVTLGQESIELKISQNLSLRFCESISAHYIANIIKAIAW